jgi:hypothetical protein
MLTRAAVPLFVLLLTSPALAAPPESLLERPLVRHGFHFQVAFGAGGGPSSGGLLHSMEIGYTFGERGYTLAYDHLFLLTDGIAPVTRGSGMFGGHMLVFKMPVLWNELSLKVGAGIGESVNLQNGFKPFFGVGWLYGLDFDVPFFRTSGLTLGVVSFHAVTVDVGHQWGIGSVLAYTWF